MNVRIERFLEENGGIISTKNAVSLGFSKMTLVKYVKDGKLSRISQGIYAKSGEIYDEMFAISQRYPDLIFSHETALWLNGLVDRDPLVYSVTLSRMRNFGRSNFQQCIPRRVCKKLFEIGLSWKNTEFGNCVRCYNAERTLCDMVRNEDNVNVELMIEGLRRYCASKTKNLPALLSIARTFGVYPQMQRYMWVLL